MALLFVRTYSQKSVTFDPQAGRKIVCKFFAAPPDCLMYTASHSTSSSNPMSLQCNTANRVHAHMANFLHNLPTPVQAERGLGMKEGGYKRDNPGKASFLL